MYVRYRVSVVSEYVLVRHVGYIQDGEVSRSFFSNRSW